MPPSKLTIDPISVPIRMLADGSLRIGQTRVLLELVLEAFRDGSSPEEIAQAFTTLSLPDVYAVATWYLQNRAAGDEYLSACQQEADELQQRLEPKLGMSREMRERLLARRSTGIHPC